MKPANSVQCASNDALPLRFLKEALIAFSFDIGGIIAGFIVASQLNVFLISPWAIAVYPAILTARGVISGLFSGRLSTALHIGTIHPKLLGNTKKLLHAFQIRNSHNFRNKRCNELFIYGVWKLFLGDNTCRLLFHFNCHIGYHGFRVNKLPAYN